MNKILSIDGCLLNIQMKRGMQRIVGGLIQIPEALHAPFSTDTCNHGVHGLLSMTVSAHLNSQVKQLIIH
jgi:hypothetical protein